MRGIAAVVWMVLVVACGGRSPRATTAPRPPEAPSPPRFRGAVARAAARGRLWRWEEAADRFLRRRAGAGGARHPPRRSAHPGRRRRIAEALRGVQAVERAGARGLGERSGQGRQDRSAVEHAPAFGPPGRGAGGRRGLRDRGLREQRPAARHRRRRRCGGGREPGRRVDHGDRARQRHGPVVRSRRREAHRHRALIVAEGLQERSERVLVLLRIDYCASSVLFTGDAEADEEPLVLKQLAHADLLQVGHHGSNTSTTAPFLAKVTPTYAIISVGKQNEGTNLGYCHPSKSTVDVLTEAMGGPGQKSIRAYDASKAKCNVQKPRYWVDAPASDTLWSTARDGEIVLTTAGDGIFARE